MGWIQKLNEVYDTMIQVKPAEGENQTTLVPVGFIQKPVKYLVTITEEGEFSSAREHSAQEVNCIIPSTPQAEARTGSKGAPFPLAEQLKYLAQDGKENPQFLKYLNGLRDWCEQPDAPDCLKTLLSYLEKGTLLQDMRECKGFTVKYHKDDVKKDGSGADAKAFVCFAVEDFFADETRLWLREDVKQSWKNYISRETGGKRMLCYATGEQRNPLDNHPKIQGNAKLISAKDAGYPFQYKGRFAEDRSAATVSEYASLRAHNALKYLLEKQGFRKYGLQIVAWNVKAGAIPVPLEEQDEDDDEEDFIPPDTFEQYGKALAEAASGKHTKFKSFQEQIGGCSDTAQRMAATVVLGMEAATDGRMSINYYQEIDGIAYAQRLQSWYESCCWEYYKKDVGFFIQTPSNLNIARAVMGTDSVQRARQDVRCEKSDAKQLRDLYKRLLSCIVDGAPLPQSMIDSAVHRAEFPLSFTRSDSWYRADWENCVRTTCALIRKARADSRNPVLQTRVDHNNTNRDYLYGRLFAVADMIERNAVDDKSKYLPTNAIRMMQFYVQRPAEGWKQLHLKLIPYLPRLGKDYPASYYQKVIGQIEQLFASEDRNSNAPLKEDFLLGMYAQQWGMHGKAEQVSEYTVSSDRSELFGCMLAIADCAEWNAESERMENHIVSAHDGKTQALRMMSAFAARPVETWEQIHAKLLPYLEKLGIRTSSFYLSQLHKIECSFDESDRLNNTPLDTMFIHGYYCMRQCLISKNTRLVVPEISVLHQTAASREEAYAMLLALENRIERTVLDIENDEKENRVSNAVRFMRKFSQQPYTTWKYLAQRMQPYAKKLKRYRPKEKLSERINTLTAQLEENHWNVDAPLQSGWLHFYYTNYYNKGELVCLF